MRVNKAILGFALVAVTWANMGIAAPRSRAPNPNQFGPWKDLGTLGNGRRTFLELNCYQCHGNNGTGGGRAPDLTPASTGGISYDQVYNVLMRGEPYGGMPSFAQYVTTDDIFNIYTYINNFGQSNQPTFQEWWVNDPKY